MRVRTFLAVFASFLSPLAFAKAQVSLGFQSAPLRITQKTEAPGISLSPGSYTIRIADHLSDRIIVQIQKSGSNNPAILLAYANPSLAGNGSGPVTFNSGLKNKPTLRGYAFSGGPVVEFVYPKKDAVTLAKANDVAVMAVDPASENLPKLPELTPADRKEVTLWILTPTPVQPGSSQPGIQAARYQAPANNSTQPALAEANNAPASNPQPYTRAQSYNPPSRPAAKAPVQVASNERPQHLRPPVKALPHTASSLPLIWLGACLSLLLGGALTGRRWLAGSRA